MQVLKTIWLIVTKFVDFCKDEKNIIISAFINQQVKTMVENDKKLVILCFEKQNRNVAEQVRIAF